MLAQVLSQHGLSQIPGALRKPCLPSTISVRPPTLHYAVMGDTVKYAKTRNAKTRKYEVNYAVKYAKMRNVSFIGSSGFLLSTLWLENGYLQPYRLPALLLAHYHCLYYAICLLLAPGPLAARAYTMHVQSKFATTRSVSFIESFDFPFGALWLESGFNRIVLLRYFLPISVDYATQFVCYQHPGQMR